MQLHPLNWEDFLEAFDDKYFPETIRYELEAEFMELQHKDLTVAEYEKRFNELSRYTPLQLPIKSDSSLN